MFGYIIFKLNLSIQFRQDNTHTLIVIVECKIFYADRNDLKNLNISNDISANVDLKSTNLKLIFRWLASFGDMSTKSLTSQKINRERILPQI